jgi:hypothetical protein
MTSIPGRDIQRELLAITRKSQETVVHMIKAWAEVVGKVQAQPLADKLRNANVLRTPEEALADAYRLAERLLDAQRKFAEDLLRATVPLLGRTRPAPAETPEPTPETPEPTPETPEPTPETPEPAQAPQALEPTQAPEAIEPTHTPEAIEPTQAPEALEPAHTPEAPEAPEVTNGPSDH